MTDGPSTEDERIGNQGEQSDHEEHREHPEDGEHGAPDDLATPPRTGDPLVDEALARAATALDAEPAEQLETYVGTHRSLQDRLADSGA